MSADDTYDEQVSQKIGLKYATDEEVLRVADQVCEKRRGLFDLLASEVGPGFDVWVDFNDVSDKGQTGTLLKFATRPLHVGDLIKAGDHEGNVCRGSVVEIVGEYALVDLDLSSFAWLKPRVVGRFGPVDPWTVEMLAAIADANEAYEDCE